MEILPVRRVAIVCFLVSLFVVSFCNADSKTVEVVGVGECADCAEHNFDTSQSFSGLRVTIECKAKSGVFKTRGSGELDKEGNFKVFLPDKYVKDDKLKEECHAQLHSASADACPSHGGLESSKIIFKYKSNEKHQFGLKGKLKFSPITCASATFWNHPPLPTFPFHHHHPLFTPPIYNKPNPPPVPVYKPPVYDPPPVPVYKKPNPPPVPVYEPPVNKPSPVPVYKKPCPPPVPKHKKPHPPSVPVYTKPHPPPVPKHKKPHPSPVPVYTKPLPRPPVPVYKKPLPPPVPTYKPKPHPSIPYKPFPPIPKIPCPPLPKIPPKYFHHHKFGKWPTLPPFAPHHP